MSVVYMVNESCCRSALWLLWITCIRLVIILLLMSRTCRNIQNEIDLLLWRALGFNGTTGRMEKLGVDGGLDWNLGLLFLMSLVVL